MKNSPTTRIEHDSMGELAVPADALYGAQTQRAVQNFPISDLRMPPAFIHALGQVKAACAKANQVLGHLDAARAQAIASAAMQVSDGKVDGHFPIDVFQTGSGTSTNMNANEVIAHLANAEGKVQIHPNDHVNMGQSSNDVIPTTIQVSAWLQVNQKLLPAIAHLRGVIDRRAKELAHVVKTGRTHLMDAMPITFEQELACWSAQLASAEERIQDTGKRLRRLPQGGTAVGTGINADPKFAETFAAELTTLTGVQFERATNLFEGIASQDVSVELSGQLNALAVAMMKIANDLRWMNSGPLAGLAEVELPSLQPGSSIMPGKVNPVIPEAAAMVCAQVMGNHTTITVGGQSGNFQLNVMLPVIALNLLQSIDLLANISIQLADTAIAGFKVREDHVAEAVARNPILVTALNPVIGYEKGAATAKQAYKEGRPILEVALETTGLSEKELKALLDPAVLAKGGIHSAPES